MRFVNDFADYEMIDTSGGEKLERWGTHVLVRPDPQIIWNTKKEHPLWKRADARYHRSNKGGGQWEFFKQLPESWTVSYRSLTFRIRPTGFKHTGLFPEQAVNWAFLMETIKQANRPLRVLNLFAYTGGATLACAAAGAEVERGVGRLRDAARPLGERERDPARTGLVREQGHAARGLSRERGHR